MTTFNGWKYDFEAGRDHVLGAILDAPLNENGDWEKYLPSPEYQAENGYEPNACVSFSSLNGIETYLNFKGEKVTRGWSDRFLAKASGTDPNSGNTYRNVLDTIRKLGVPLEDKWPSDGVETLEEFYQALPPKLYEEARKDFSDVWTVKYEEVPVDSIDTMLRYSPILISVTAWFQDGEYFVDMGIPNNHAVLCFKKIGDIYYIFDSYDNAIKKYKGKVQQAKRIWVGPTEEQNTITLSVFDVLKKNSLLALFANWWQSFQAPPPIPMPTSSIPTTPPKYEWDTPQKARHSVRVICDEEGLNLEKKNTLCATLGCESGWNNNAKNENIRDGKTWSTDWGICQINDYWHCGKGKSFPSAQYVVDHPDEAVRWMARQWKLGNRNYWVCYSKGMYKKYL